MNAKKMIENANKEKRKFFRKTRRKIRFVKDNIIENGEELKVLHKKGQISEPHELMAEQFVADGLAEFV